jgi:hypothetical protein
MEILAGIILGALLVATAIAVAKQIQLDREEKKHGSIHNDSVIYCYHLHDVSIDHTLTAESKRKSKGKKKRKKQRAKD